MQLRQDVTRSDGQPDYIGYASRGVASSQAAWTIHKFTYSGNNMTLRQLAYRAIWDNRATETYA